MPTASNTLDLSNKGLQKIEANFLRDCIGSEAQASNDDRSQRSVSVKHSDERHIEIALFDGNCLGKLENIEKLTNLKHVNMQNVS